MNALELANLVLISIHALLAESDILSLSIRVSSSRFLSTLSLRRATRKGFAMRWNTCISIHALLAESDFGLISAGFIGGLFLSTLSLRRATILIIVFLAGVNNFYPRSPCGERHFRRAFKRSIRNFYPRSPCGERLLRKVPILGIK